MLRELSYCVLQTSNSCSIDLSISGRLAFARSMKPVARGFDKPMSLLSTRKLPFGTLDGISHYALGGVNGAPMTPSKQSAQDIAR